MRGLEELLFYISSSELRQIPDNQEVFLDRNSDASLVIEILEPPVDEQELSLNVE